MDPASDDMEPIVVLDDDEPALSPAGQDYLRSQGLTDERTWAAFRLGTVTDADEARLLTPTQRRQLRPAGFWMPAADPRDPATVTGLVRLTPAQNQHRTIGCFAGIAGPVDLDRHQRIVLTTAPLTALRLYQAGVRDVAHVEEPAALAALTDWLADRAVVLTAHKHADLDALRSALGQLGERATSVLLSMSGGQLSSETRTQLGLPLAEPATPPPLTPLHLAALHRYAVERIDAGEGAAALAALDADDVGLVRRCRLGFLPAGYQQALATLARQALHGLRLAGSVVMPATDTEGRIVDLLTVYARMPRSAGAGCFPEPRGLLGAEAIVGAEQLIVTDTFRWFARLVRQGYGASLLLRGPADAAQNAARIAATGVRSAVVRCRRDGEAIAAALAAAGIAARVETGVVTGADWIATVPAAAPAPQPVAVPEAPATPLPIAEPAAQAMSPEPEPPPVRAPAAPPTLTLVSTDAQVGVVCAEIGPIRYAIASGDVEGSIRQVTARRGQAVHQDRIDLDVPAQVTRFASSAGRRVGIPAGEVAAHLTEAWRLLREQEQARDLLPTVPVAAAERAEAETLLRTPDLLERIAADLAALGWQGEDANRRLLYLTATSRLLPTPVWSVYRATAGAAPWRSLGIIAALMPPEACIVFHRLTESVLRRSDRTALMHKLLLIDRAETLRPEGAIALRCLREWGGVGWQQVAQAEGATSVGMIGDVRGPVAVLAAAAGDLDRRCRDGFLTVTVDDSPEQTVRLLADQRLRHRQGEASAAEIQAIIRRHHAMQRLLRPGRVVIPFSDRIAFPMTSVRHRDEHAVFLDLIAASALLHQYQRERDASGAFVAVEADFHHAVGVAGHLLGVSPDGLSAAGRQLLQRLFATGTPSFVLADLGGLIADWTAYTYRAAAEELVAMGYCTAQGGGQGRARRYTRIAQGSATPGIALLPVGSAMDTTATLRPFDALRGVSKGSTPVTAAG